MKAFLGLIMALAMSTVLWAQHGGEGGNTCDIWGQTVNDITCNAYGCSNATFTAPDCPTFYLICDIIGSNCTATHCRVTATVYRASDGHEMGHQQNWDQSGNCGGGQPVYAAITLAAGVQYKLKVCSDACPEHDCSECVNCTAQGIVSVNHP